MLIFLAIQTIKNRIDLKSMNYAYNPKSQLSAEQVLAPRLYCYQKQLMAKHILQECADSKDLQETLILQSHLKQLLKGNLMNILE